MKCLMCSKTVEKQKLGRQKETCKNCYPTYRRAYSMCNTAEFRSKKKNLDFDLDVKWIFDRITGKCPKLGFQFRLEHSGASYRDRHPLTPSLDRIDHQKGYTKDNTQVVCWWYNVAKQTFSDQGMDNLCRLYVHYQDKLENERKISKNTSSLSMWSIK